MRRYKHLSAFDQDVARGLRAAKETTGIPINQLLNLCVKRALETLTTELQSAAMPTTQQTGWDDFLDKPRRPGLRSNVADELRALDRQ